MLPFEVPRSLRAEHERIQAALSRAESAPEPVGGPARELSELLGMHVEREEFIALAPLGLLGPLAAGQYADEMQTVLPRTGVLRSGLPELLQAHDMIRAALRRLEAAARRSSNADVERLAQDLVAHLSIEEEVLYPAALLVGAVVQAHAEQRQPP